MKKPLNLEARINEPTAVLKERSNESARIIKPVFGRANKVETNVTKKLADREERRKQMYKSRGVNTTAQKKENLKGVRSNRRFDLLMKYRQQQEDAEKKTAEKV